MVTPTDSLIPPSSSSDSSTSIRSVSRRLTRGFRKARIPWRASSTPQDKRVVMQNMSLVLRYLCDVRRVSLALRRAEQHPEDAGRRAQVLINIIAWVQYRLGQERIEFEFDANGDEVLADRAIAYLRNALRSAWRRFGKNANTIVNALKCQRARTASGGTRGPNLRPDGSSGCLQEPGVQQCEPLSGARASAENAKRSPAEDSDGPDDGGVKEVTCRNGSRISQLGFAV